MSLDFYLEIDDKIVFDANITHNLGKMADAANLYRVLWRPDELGFTTAKECIDLISIGLADLVRNKAKYKAYDSANGWGIYEHFVPFVIDVLAACKEFPNAKVTVSR